jgi:hypothetical protein
LTNMQARARRNLIIIGVVMLVAMGASTILPLLTQNMRAANQPQTQPTDVPIPTFPPPIDNLQGVSFDQTYFHPSGLFSVGQPSGWDSTQPLTNTDTARVTMTNNAALSVVEVSVVQPETPVTTLDELDARYTTEYLNQSWSRYQSEHETARRREDDKIVIDFEMALNRQNYVARQMSWTDGDWIYEVRVVTPENATDTLVYVLDNIVPTLRPNKQFAGTPTDWNAYHDQTSEAFIRYPADWTLEDSAEGRLTSIAGSTGEVLRVEHQPDASVTDDDAARAWVEANIDGAEILSVQPVTRGENTGFAVAYNYNDLDGEANSGLAVLLNGEDNALRIANLRFPEAGVDLNSEGAREGYDNLVTMMDTFMLLPVTASAEATEEAPAS